LTAAPYWWLVARFLQTQLSCQTAHPDDFLKLVRLSFIFVLNKPLL